MPKFSRRRLKATAGKAEVEQKASVPSGPAITQSNITCPLCGRANSGREFWDRLPSWAPGHRLGVIQEVGLGRGLGLQVVGEINTPEESEGVFQIIKNRWIAIGKYWLEQGWMAEEELEELK